MSMIYGELQKLEQSAVIELFELVLGTETLRFHGGTNGLHEPVVWQGNTYQPLPVQASGFEMTGKGAFPRPKISLANVEGVISQTIQEHGDLVGNKLIRRRTLAKFLDAVNFPEGNPTADPTSELPADTYFIDRKSSENRVVVEYELASSMDVSGIQLPRRQIIQNACSWKYRGADCGYTGGPCADQFDNPTTNPALDKCGKRLSSCKIRFGEDGILPYGGFPAAGLVRT